METNGTFLERTAGNKYFWFAAAAALSVITPNPAVGLALGLAIALTVGNPAQKETSAASKKLLQLSVILLGFGMRFDAVLKVGFASLDAVLKVGFASLWVTLISISATLAIGSALGKVFGIERRLAVLLSSGTAICGGSAIAAMAPAISASSVETGVAMAVIFLFNGIALFLFPPLGHLIGLTQEQFGFWAALAIHDTSSVVGAASIYGAAALAIGATVKLTRALWILPVSYLGARLAKSEAKAKFQWFLLGFLLAALVRSLAPQFGALWDAGSLVGKHMMTGTLFLIGGGLGRAELKKIGAKPLVMAAVLWCIISCLSLAAVKLGFMPALAL